MEFRYRQKTQPSCCRICSSCSLRSTAGAPTAEEEGEEETAAEEDDASEKVWGRKRQPFLVTRFRYSRASWVSGSESTRRRLLRGEKPSDGSF